MRFFHSLRFLLLSLLLVPSLLSAGEIDLDTTIIGQVRENENDLTEVPVNGYFGLAIEGFNKKLSGETSMRLFHDFPRKLDDYDLYQAVVHARPINLLQFDVGRQFVTQGFYAAVIDGIRIKFNPPGKVDLTVYSGMPRTVEIGDFDTNDGLLTGLSVGLKEVPRTNLQANVAWRSANVRRTDLRENDEVLAGLAGSYQFKASWRPTLYGLAEYNVTSSVFDTGTFGIDVYPHARLGLNAEFDYFNASRDFSRPSILALFTSGPTFSGRFSSTVTLIPDRLDFEESYAYQRLEIQNGLWQNGHLFDSIFSIYVDEVGLLIQPGGYFSKSFGGTLYGGRALLHEKFTSKIDAEASVDFTKYSKITGNNDIAFSTVLWAGYEVIKGLKLSAGFEYNINNSFDRDIRGSFMIRHVFKHGI